MKGFTKDGKFRPTGKSSGLKSNQILGSEKKKTFSPKLNVHLSRFSAKKKSIEIDSVSREKAQEIFKNLGKTVTAKRPNAKHDTVMLAGGIHMTTWEDTKGNILLQAKFFDIPKNKVRITAHATKFLVKN